MLHSSVATLEIGHTLIQIVDAVDHLCTTAPSNKRGRQGIAEYDHHIGRVAVGDLAFTNANLNCDNLVNGRQVFVCDIPRNRTIIPLAAANMDRRPIRAYELNRKSRALIVGVGYAPIVRSAHPKMVISGTRNDVEVACSIGVDVSVLCGIRIP